MQVLDAFDRSHVQELLAKGERFWLSLRGADAATIREAGELLELHPLAIEDSVEFGQRPKLDDYPGSALLVFFGARTGTHGGTAIPVPVEVHFHITAKAIMTVRRHDVGGTLNDARRRVSLADIDTAEEALYRVLDALVSSFSPALQSVDDEVDAIEDALLDSPRPEVRLRLLDLKHALVRIRQVVEPQRDVLAGHRDLLDQLPGFHDEGAHDILRDVYDRVALVAQQVESVRRGPVQRPRPLRLVGVQPAQRDHEGADDRRHVLPAADVRLGVLRPELRLDGASTSRRSQAFLIYGVGISALIVVGLGTWFIRAGYITFRRRQPRRTAEDTPGP